MNGIQEDRFKEANIPSNYVRIIGRELGLTMKDFHQLLECTHLSTEEMMQEDQLVNANQLIQILNNAAVLSRHPDFGLLLGQRLTPATHGLMGFVINNSPNLISVLDAVHNFMPTRISFGRIVLKHLPDSIQCELKFLIPLPAEVKKLLTETCVVFFYESIEFIIGRRPHEVSIHFEHQRPEYIDTYYRIFDAAIQFSSATTRMEIPYQICRIANPSSNKDVYRLALEQCQKLSAQLQSEDLSYSNKMQRIILSNPVKQITEEFIAAELFISKRTLARKLKNEGTSYQKVLDDMRSKQALDYLRETNLSIAAIASILNFHDSTNFRRAFKRWFKMTPSEYRSQLKMEPTP